MLPLLEISITSSTVLPVLKSVTIKVNESSSLSFKTLKPTVILELSISTLSGSNKTCNSSVIISSCMSFVSSPLPP